MTPHARRALRRAVTARTSFRPGRPARVAADIDDLRRRAPQPRTAGQAMNEARREEALRKLRRAVNLAGLPPAQRVLWDLLLEHLQEKQ